MTFQGVACHPQTPPKSLICNGTWSHEVADRPSEAHVLCGVNRGVNALTPQVWRIARFFTLQIGLKAAP